MSSKVQKRKIDHDNNDQTSDEDISFDKGEDNVKVEEAGGLGRGKRRRTKVSSQISQVEMDVVRDYDDELADEYEKLSDYENHDTVDISKPITFKSNFDAGQIVELEMKDFMCHRRFTVKLGRRLNFIVGKNGSGKSAIATALQLCLGATARNTGRGSALSTFIREGSNGPASVKVTLVNEGSDAYLPEIYGKRIIVERRIAKGTGSGGYHIYNEQKQEISTRREDLEKILRCFNIYVDNPCCVLTQEESKKFVFGKDTDKYDFFLKATGLYNLREDLIKIKGELEDTAKVKEVEEGKLEIKKQAAEELYEKTKKLEKLEEMEQDIKVCTAKIYWEGYRRDYEKLSAKENEIKKIKSEKVNAETAYDRASKRQDNQGDEIQQLTEKVVQLENEQQTLANELEKRNAAYRQASAALHQFNTTHTNHVNQLNEEKRRIREIDIEIKQKRDKMKQTANADAILKHQQLEHVTETIESLKQREKDFRQKINVLSSELAKMNEEKQSAKHVMDSAENAIRSTREQMEGFKSSKNNRAMMIADYMPNMLNQLPSLNFRENVVGPIGSCVTIKQGCEDWSRAVERCLGSVLRSFVTTNMSDRNLISQLQQQYEKARGVPVYTQHRSRRYNINPMPQGVVCLADVVNIPDDTVFNCLVDQFSIDRIVLVRDENEVLNRYVEQRDGRDSLRFDAISAITRDGTLIRYNNGNQSSEVSRFAFRNILSADTSAMVEAAQRTIELKHLELQDAARHFNEMSVQLSSSVQTLQQFKQEVNQIGKEIQHHQRQKETLQDELEEISQINAIDLSPLELERDDRERAVEALQMNIQQISLDIQQAKIGVAQAKKLKEEVDLRKQAILSEMKKIEEKIDGALADREAAKRKLDLFKRQLDEKTAVLQQEILQFEEQQEKLEEKRQEAVTATSELLGEDQELWGFDPHHLSHKENAAYLEKQIKSLKAEIAESKKEIGLKGGLTIEVLKERYHRAQSEYVLLAANIETLKDNYDLLVKNQQERQSKWLKALRESTDITKRKFDYYVQQKGSSGTIKFNHKEKKLEITYQVDNNDKESKANDIRNLSGGERSFVTFSVLLALGHVIECPFRLMDEYDVFLDNISRRLTLDQLQSYAKRADQLNRQFIIITPHDVSAVKTGQSVKIIAMPEPQRLSAQGLQQQTLN